nr:MAG TPA: hypothetical protein [Bacteriophage sp.]
MTKYTKCKAQKSKTIIQYIQGTKLFKMLLYRSNYYYLTYRAQKYIMNVTI